MRTKVTKGGRVAFCLEDCQGESRAWSGIIVHLVGLLPLLNIWAQGKQDMSISYSTPDIRSPSKMAARLLVLIYGRLTLRQALCQIFTLAYPHDSPVGWVIFFFPLSPNLSPEKLINFLKVIRPYRTQLIPGICVLEGWFPVLITG